MIKDIYINDLFHTFTTRKYKVFWVQITFYLHLSFYQYRYHNIYYDKLSSMASKQNNIRWIRTGYELYRTFKIMWQYYFVLQKIFPVTIRGKLSILQYDKYIFPFKCKRLFNAYQKLKNKQWSLPAKINFVSWSKWCQGQQLFNVVHTSL